MSITIDPDFRALIPPLSDEERRQLEANLVADKVCRDPLVVWKGQGILLDGHNRFEICTRLGIPYQTVEMEFDDRDAAEDWIDCNQLGRRNLSPDQADLLLGRRYNRAKKQGQRTDLTSHQNDGKSTASRLAAQHGVSVPTIERAGAFARAVEATKSIDPEIEKKVASGQAPPKSAVVKAAQLLESHPDKAKAILRGDVTTAEVVREVRRAEVIAELEDTRTKEAKAVAGVYDVVVVDPPWPMRKSERDIAPEQVGLDYPTMSEAELAALKLPCADNCHVWLWTTHAYLPMAFRLLDVWGLKYVCTFVWHKPGGFQVFGLPQFNCEFALYARKGTPQFIDTKAFFTCFDAPRGEHSEKPAEFYDVLRRVTAGRRIDMFNRRAIYGFDGWGNEAQAA